MNFNSFPYNQDFLEALQADQTFNDAVAYGADIQEAEVADGEQYWRVIGIHHLLPKENEGDHTILVEALDEQGNRIRQGKLHAASTFENNQHPPKVSALDKSDMDPMGCDFPMFKDATYSVWIKGAHRDANDPSDRVEKLHTRHRDEAPGNTIGHHSFYVVFQRTRKGPTVLDPEAVRIAAQKLLDEEITADSPLTVHALEHDLGPPVTPEFTAGGYRARGFVKGIVFTPLRDADQIEHMEW